MEDPAGKRLEDMAGKEKKTMGWRENQTRRVEGKPVHCDRERVDVDYSR